jgi:predicted phosphoribosyltransferase
VRYLFSDREDAGRKLAAQIRRGPALKDPVVLALPRGGVPVGLEIARALDAPLDVLIVRKLGHPWQPELAMGAIASGGALVMNPEVMAVAGLSDTEVEAVIAEERRELARRETAYRGTHPPIPVLGRSVILVDDGVATGSTMFAAIQALRAMKPSSIMVAVPLAPADTLARLRTAADFVACVATPEPFRAVGLWYDHFDQLTDAEVRDFLETRASEFPAAR